jgi:hypothetical protein
MKKLIVIIVLVLLVIGAKMFYFSQKEPPKEAEEAQVFEHPLIRVSSPTPNSLVGSPLRVKGEARGNWYFEASFPVRLFDGNGKEIAVVPAQAEGEWMTTEFVPFEVSLTFAKPETDTGLLVLEKDNASGLPEHDDKFSIPVRFSQ